MGQELGKSGALMARWSSRHGWPERAAAWDAHLDVIALDRMARVHSDSVGSTMEVAATAQEPFSILIAAIARRLAANAHELEEWPLKDLFRLFIHITPAYAKAVELERQARFDVLRALDVKRRLQ